MNIMYSCDQLRGLGSSAGKFGRLMGSILEAWVPQEEIFHEMLRGCLHDKIALTQVSYRDDFLILYYVDMMMGHFISQLFECTLHVGKINV